MAHPNLYEILGLSRTATTEEITLAFRERVTALQSGSASADPETQEQSEWLQQAYQVLSDPKSRREYDATLPITAQKMDKDELWRTAAKIFFEQSERFTPAVDAMRVGRPLAFDDNRLLVIGLEPGKAQLAGYLTTSLTHNQVRKILCDLYGHALDFRVIVGTTPEDWFAVREGEAKVHRKRYGDAAAMRDEEGETSSAKPLSTNAEEVWSDLIEAMNRSWSAMDNRAFPQNRARFVQEQLPQLLRAEGISRSGALSEEMTQRCLARALDRIASITSIESGVVGLEYLHYRARMLGG